jgi:putative component of toxin-antitoxin plasmid stabilization module
MPDILYSMITLNKTIEFSDWLNDLTWKEQGQINARLSRIQNSGHFGDAKNLGNGLAELRWKNG